MIEVSSDFVGYKLNDYEISLSWRDTMNYAAAVNDNNPWYLDDERQSGIIAPPMYSTALTWPILKDIRQNIPEGMLPSDALMRLVHHIEAIEFHQPIKPGSRLKIGGKVAAVIPHRSGTLVVFRLDAFNSEMELVFTEHIGALLRGVPCKDKGRGQDALPKHPSWPGENRILWETKVGIHQLQTYIYDGCTGIHFPIHTSRRFARGVGLPGIILQGTATMAFALKEIINREADGNPSCLKSTYCKFTSPVKPGTNITIQLKGRKKQSMLMHLFFEVLNDEGGRAIKNGYACLHDNIT